MLEVWGRRSAYNVQKVLWFMDELGVGYKHINIGGAAGGLDSDEFLAMNPNGRIPVTCDDGFCVWESNTIVRYLANKYGNEKYWVADPRARTLSERWMDWELASLQPDFLALFWSYFRTPECNRDGEKIEHAMKRCDRHLSILDGHLSNNRFVAGGEFSIGDISVGTCFYRYFNMGLDVPVFHHVQRWYQELSQRRAYRENIMVPFEELRGRVEF